MSNTPAEPVDGRAAVTAWFSSRIGGILVPIAATVLAFLIGGLVVLVTGHNPWTAYKAIFEGTGLTWFANPWDLDSPAANDLQQTLVLMTPLILTGLAVAFAFRSGLFNIGGQGQYWVGFFAALWIGTNFEDMARPLHVLIAILASIVAGGIWGGIAGLLKATVGAHEVITTIMLNWIAIFVGSYLVEIGGALAHLGQPPLTPRRDLHRALRARRLLRAPEQDDARLRDPCGGLQSGGRALQRHIGGPELLPRHGDLGRVRRTRRLRRSPRLQGRRLDG
jgi:ABC-type uncharacterized transport system permease subunit